VDEARSEPAAQPREPALAARVDFPCGNCGASLTWNPDTDALTCEHCGHRVAVPRADAAIVERPLAAAGESARGLGAHELAVRCGNCGAVVELAPAATTAACAFCGSSQVTAQASNRNALRPESLIPLDVGRAAVEQGFRRWIGGLWFRPAALKAVRAFDAIGVYVPGWTFDARVHSDWSADAGHYYWTTELVPVMRGGKLRMEMRRVRKIRWVPAWGARDDTYDDVLVHASKGVPDGLLRELGAFDLRALVPYRPEYLAGWRAEEYQVDLEQAWERARSSIVASQERRCAGDVPGDTHRNLRVRNEISDVRWKHVLLPVWTLTYRYGGKPYTVLVHGQTGLVRGRAPLSWIKIAAAASAVIAAALIVLAIAAAAN
jgi:DNA-directed RNA polymerase subunit RPC12/RpoP